MPKKYPTLNYEQFKEIHSLWDQLESVDISTLDEKQCRIRLAKLKQITRIAYQPNKN